MDEIKHFYKKDYQTRLQIVADWASLTPKQVSILKNNFSKTGNQMIENYLTDFLLPEGIATNFEINGEKYLIPMVIEEPSVIAAASNGAQMLGNIRATVKSRILTGEIILKTPAQSEFPRWFQDNKAQVIKIAGQAHPSLKKYGKIADLKLTTINDEYLALELTADVGDAMGANTMNTMLEAVGDYLQGHQNQNVLMSILSNYGDENLVTASGTVPFEKLGPTEADGQKVAAKINEASQVAQLYPKRAATHNKGIMNGIDAVALACGNDWRAIESSAHSFAAFGNHYHGLSTWTVEKDGLNGTITLPIPAATVGGATHLLELSKINLKLLKITNATELMAVLASVGLANNLAALKALVTNGIQKGHMGLQFKSLALSAGATAKQVPAVVEKLKKLPREKQNLESAKQIINKLD